MTDNGTSGVTTYTYDQTNQLSTMTYPNGVSHAFQYDVRDRAIQLNVNGPSAAITSYQQTFSPSGRKLSAAEMNGRTANYGYDAIYRLLTEGISSDPTASNNGMLTYALDPVGNRQSLTSTLAALGSESFTYDADDRLTTDTYDANGNTLGSGGTTYTYDFEDRLVSTSTGVQIVCDGDGNRVWETANGTATKYLIDDQTPTGYAQVAEELVSGAVSAQFTYGLTRISQDRAGALSYYGYDAGGSTRELVNSSGSVTDTYDYDAFGNTVAQSGSTLNEFLYRGEQFDAALQMYYLRARYYIPKTGRFLTRDSEIGGRTFFPATLHKYLYAVGDPIRYVDPKGRDILSQAILIGAGINLKVQYSRFLGCVATLALDATVVTLYELTPLGKVASSLDCIAGAVAVFDEIPLFNLSPLVSPGFSAAACAASFWNFSKEAHEETVGTGQLSLETFDTLFTCSMAAFEAMGALVEIIE